MQDKTIEKEISSALNKIEELIECQINNACEILTYRNMIAYLLFLLEQQKSPQDGDFFEFSD